MTAFASQLPDFTDLLAAAGSSSNIPAAIVEKDYYLCRALRVVADRHAGQFILKGGTSLSKGWNLLERFSEDIDLLMRTEAGGKEISKGARERRLKGTRNTLAQTEGFRLSEGVQPAEKGIHRTAEFNYRSAVESLTGLSNTVKLEMGTRGGTNPATVRCVTSMVTQFITSQRHTSLADDLISFDFEMLDIRRTFVEKLFTVHAAFHEDRARNRTRHYYDLYRICSLPEVREFAGTTEYREMFLSVKQYSLECFPKAAVPAGNSLAESPALSPQGNDLHALEANYAQEKHLFFTQPPTLTAILSAIQQFAPKL